MIPSFNTQTAPIFDIYLHLQRFQASIHRMEDNFIFLSKITSSTGNSKVKFMFRGNGCLELQEQVHIGTLEKQRDELQDELKKVLAWWSPIT
ncbi:unnamed protein product [Camellia sinensis]